VLHRRRYILNTAGHYLTFYLLLIKDQVQIPERDGLGTSNVSRRIKYKIMWNIELAGALNYGVYNQCIMSLHV
jgi:hypothetical protein